MAKFLYPLEPQPERILFEDNADRALSDQLLGYGGGGLFVVEASRKKLLAIEHPVTVVPWHEVEALRIDRYRALLAGIFGLFVTVLAVGGAVATLLFSGLETFFNLIYLFLIGLGFGPVLLFGVRRLRLEAVRGSHRYRFTSKAMQGGMREAARELIGHCLDHGVELRSNLLPDEDEGGRPAPPEGGRRRDDDA